MITLGARLVAIGVQVADRDEQESMRLAAVARSRHLEVVPA